MPISLFFSAECDRIGTLTECGYYYVQHKSSAMHNFKGLKNYQLPYRALEDSIKKVRELGIKNSPEFYELFVLRILCTCLFDLGRGASRDKLRELCQYIRYILRTYFPEYAKNPKNKDFFRSESAAVPKGCCLASDLSCKKRASGSGRCFTEFLREKEIVDGNHQFRHSPLRRF